MMTGMFEKEVSGLLERIASKQLGIQERLNAFANLAQMPDVDSKVIDLFVDETDATRRLWLAMAGYLLCRDAAMRQYLKDAEENPDHLLHVEFQAVRNFADRFRFQNDPQYRHRKLSSYIGQQSNIPDPSPENVVRIWRISKNYREEFPELAAAARIQLYRWGISKRNQKEFWRKGQPFCVIL